MRTIPSKLKLVALLFLLPMLAPCAVFQSRDQADRGGDLLRLLRFVPDTEETRGYVIYGDIQA